jgi:hypothetical protein
VSAADPTGNPERDAAMTALERLLPAATSRLVRERLDGLLREDVGLVIAIHGHIARLRRERSGSEPAHWA